MDRNWVSLILGFGSLGIVIWASDRITLQGERTIYTVTCKQGIWDGLACSGRLMAGDRYRFRASRSQNEVVYGIAGLDAPSGKHSDCQVANRDNWACNVRAGESPSIAREFSRGKPIRGNGLTLPFYAVAKWKWWTLRTGIPVFRTADYGNESTPPSLRDEQPDAVRAD
jgi:hypothetical protein